MLKFDTVIIFLIGSYRSKKRGLSPDNSDVAEEMHDSKENSDRLVSV